MSLEKLSTSIKSLMDRLTKKETIMNVNYLETTTKQPSLTCFSQTESNQPKETKLNDFNFNDRTSYLAWRKQWKAQYKQLSADIRATKIAFKEIQRKITIKTTAYGNMAMLNDRGLGYQKEYYDPLNNLVRLRKEATDMLFLLETAKTTSKEMREEAKQAKA